MSIKMIATVGKNNEIGKDNDLIWQLPRGDMLTRCLTMDQYILLGSKAFEALKKSLNRRTILVLSSRPLELYSDVVKYDSVEKVLRDFVATDRELFVMGGESLFHQFLPLCESMYLTEVNANAEEANAYFPDFDKNQWNRKVINKDTENGVSYTQARYVRKKVRF